MKRNKIMFGLIKKTLIRLLATKAVNPSSKLCPQVVENARFN